MISTRCQSCDLYRKQQFFCEVCKRVTCENCYNEETKDCMHCNHADAINPSQIELAKILSQWAKADPRVSKTVREEAVAAAKRGGLRLVDHILVVDKETGECSEPEDIKIICSTCKTELEILDREKGMVAACTECGIQDLHIGI